MTRLRYVLLISGVLLVAAAIAGVAQPSKSSAASDPTTTIVVTGNGSVNATPDKASFSFGVHSTAGTATEATNNLNQQANKIVDALKNAGIPDSDIQTTSVSLWPQFSRHGHTITGYHASYSVDVTAKIGDSGSLIDAAVGAGANNIDGPNLSVGDESSQYNQALKLAVANAKAQAQAIAEGAGLTLGSVMHVRNDGSTPEYYNHSFAAYGAVLSAATPIQAGSQKIQATVTVTYSAS